MLSPSIEALTCGNCLQRLDRGAEDERQVGQLDAVLREEVVLVLRADAGDVRVVDLEDRRDVRRGPLGEDHVLGGDPADLRHRDDFVAVGHGNRGTGRGRLHRLGAADGHCGASAGAAEPRLGACGDLPILEVGEDVVLRDAVVDAGALDLLDVDLVLLGDLADERRGLPADALLDRLDLSSGGGRNGGRRRGGRARERRRPVRARGSRRRRGLRGRRGLGRLGRSGRRRCGGAAEPARRLRRGRGADAACSPASPIMATTVLMATVGLR